MRALLVKSILITCAWLPLTVIHALGTVIGWGLLIIPSRIARDTRINIDLCLPELSQRQRRRLVRKSLAETGKALMETSALWMRPGERTVRLIRHADGLDVALNAHSAGNGLILAAPHLGSWEAAGLYCAAMFKMTCLYRPLRMVDLEKLVHGARSRLGAEYVPTTAPGIRALCNTMDRRGTVALLPDQEPRPGGGSFAPFFGIPAYSMGLLVRLSKRTGAPVVFTFCERLARGRGYHIQFHEAPQAIYSADTHTAVVAMNQAIESLIRKCPAQYQWSYRRFAKRPAGERTLYD
jgi:KDO2-lipid IV(A) lauroyltransferase